MRKVLGISDHFAITLDKKIPVAAGLGGGSADAAAIIRAVLKFRALPLFALCADSPDFIQDLAKFGADIPVCLFAQPAHMQGIGEKITPVDVPVKNMTCLLVNNRVSCQTSAVFDGFRPPYQTALRQETLRNLPDKKAVRLLVMAQENSLETAAMNLVPSLKQLKTDLSALPNVEMVRLAGSGGTFFATFAKDDLAKQAVKKLVATRPDLWLAVTRLRA